MQSALTGHMVLSTLHTNDAAGAITRMLDMGVEDYLLTSTVNGARTTPGAFATLSCCKVPTALPTSW